MSGKPVVRFLLARPLIAVAIAAAPVPRGRRRIGSAIRAGAACGEADRGSRGPRQAGVRLEALRVAALLGAADTLPFSRSQESEADHIGLVYMARAGYDPHQAVAFWKRMQPPSAPTSRRQMYP